MPRWPVRLAVAALACAGLLLAASSAHAGRRVALVIGNAAYQVGPLANPAHDARAVAKALDDHGFDRVILRTDLGTEAMKSALAEMAREATGADIAVIYYAGHGTERDGRNYLIPIDARLERASDLELQAIALPTVVDQIAGATRLKLVILDACRNNVFPLAGARRATSRGLARIEPEDNTLVVYAAKEGTTADDTGAEQHSPFTSSLLRHIATPGLEVSFVFRRVRDEVMSATAGRQQPHTYGTLGGEPIFLFESKAGEATAMLPPPAGGQAAPSAPSLEPRRMTLKVRIARRPDGAPPLESGLGLQYFRGDDAGFLQDYLGLPSLGGALVTVVAAGGPSEIAGVMPGDIIVRLDGHDVVKPDDLLSRLEMVPLDTAVPVELWRVGEGTADLRRAIAARAETGNVASLYILARLNDLDIGADMSPEEIAQSYRKAAEAGDANAMFQLAQSITIFGTPESLLWFRKAAEAGSHDAMTWLGHLHLSGVQVPKDAAEAVRWYRKAAEAGDPQGMSSLANMYNEGAGVAKDEEEALRWYRRAADLGDGEAMNNLGIMLEHGRGGLAKNEAEAVRWFRKAADAGESWGMTNLGQMYATGRGVAKDESEALRWHRKAAEAGNGKAMTQIGLIYEGGRGVAKDEAEAVRWYRKAAEAGNAWGMKCLGVMYERGLGVGKDETEAVRWYRKAAEAGDAWGMRNLGIMLEEGRGVAKDEAEAVSWYRKAGETGDAVGMRRLGFMYANGRDIAKDEAEAVRWFRKAAEAGDVLGMRNLGIMLEEGRGVAKNEAEAFLWFRKAGETDDPVGMRRLGIMYASGRGVAKDEAEAVRWFRKAAEAGDTRALGHLGFMYDNGRGVAEDDAEAVRLYRKAADAGVDFAMHNLAWALDFGRGTARDPAAAAKYMFQAIALGNRFSVDQMSKNSANWSKEFRKAFQERLKVAGRYSGPVDGKFGASVKQAIDQLALRGTEGNQP